MHDATKYISAAIHEGVINPKLVIDRYEEEHKAESIELGVDEEVLYAEAVKANSRNKKINMMMLISSGLLLYFFINADFNYGLDDLISKASVVFLFVFIVVFIKQTKINKDIKRIYSSENKIYSEDKLNNVIISGGYSPFSGYGYDLDGWSFTINIKKTNTKMDFSDEEEFSIKGLLDSLSIKIKDNIDEVEISDKLFVNGKDIRYSDIFMSSIMSKPKIKIDQAIVNSFIGKSDESIRHYRVINLPAWKGQIIMTVFIRFTLIGDQLFAESNFFFLTPLKAELMVLDEIPSRSGFWYFWLLSFTSLFKTTYAWALGPIWLFSGFTKFNEAIFGDPEDKLKKNATYNYAHATSLREDWSTTTYQRYFQMADKDMNYKILQHIIINDIVDYLESKGISTEDIKERQTTILNSGVMVTGGTVRAEQMSVGEGSSIVNNSKS